MRGKQDTLPDFEEYSRNKRLFAITYFTEHKLSFFTVIATVTTDVTRATVRD